MTMTVVYSDKGGQGTTTIAAGFAVLAAAHDPTLLVDLAGDMPAALGLPQPDGPGLAGWFQLHDATTEMLGRLEYPAGPGISVLPRGRGYLAPTHGEMFADWLSHDQRHVIVDAGLSSNSDLLPTLTRYADQVLLVTRPCFLALRRSMESPVKPTGIVLVAEQGRALNRRDVEDCIGVPVIAEVPVDPAIARSVDAGLLASRPPRALTLPLAASPVAA